MSKQEVRRGAVYIVDLGNKPPGIQGGERPVIVVQNNHGNMYSTTVIVAPITSTKPPTQPTHVDIQLDKPSIILTEQLLTIPIAKLSKRRVHLASNDVMLRLDHALSISLGL